MSASLKHPGDLRCRTPTSTVRPPCSKICSGPRWRAFATSKTWAPAIGLPGDWCFPSFGRGETVDVGGYTDHGEVAHTLSARIAATWTAFARSGKPDNPAIPHWPAYTVADRATLVLDRECRVANDYGRETRLLWKEIAGV